MEIWFFKLCTCIPLIKIKIKLKEDQKTNKDQPGKDNPANSNMIIWV